MAWRNRVLGGAQRVALRVKTGCVRHVDYRTDSTMMTVRTAAAKKHRKFRFRIDKGERSYTFVPSLARDEITRMSMLLETCG